MPTAIMLHEMTRLLYQIKTSSGIIMKKKRSLKRIDQATSLNEIE